jgi:hypothetical protein
MLICFFLCLFPFFRQHVQLLIFFSAAASILMFSGMISDSLGFRRINDLETCANRDTGVVSGSDEWATEASVCASNSHRLCACISGVDSTVCHDYDINKYRGQNCNLILNKYTDLLLVSLIFDTFNLAWVFILSVFSCVSYAAMVAPAAPAKEYSAPPQEEAAAPAANNAPMVHRVAAPAAATEEQVVSTSEAPADATNAI